MYRAVHFKASSPNAKANGQVLMPYLEVLKGSKLSKLVTLYSLDHLDPAAFYPQQTVCDMQKQMSEEMGLFSGELVNIGIKSIDSIGFPADVQTVQDAMGMLHQIYQMIHQNVPPEEGWIFRLESENTMKIYANFPYEPFAGYGYIYGIAHKFKPARQKPTVHMEEEDGLTVYRVEFK